MGTIIIIFAGLGILLLIASGQYHYRYIGNLARGLLITYFTIGLCMLGGELYFRFVHAESDGLPRLAVQNWQGRYWHVNTSGYRDREWKPEDWKGKTIIISGDSFAAGWDIDNPQDRFGDVLDALLGDPYAVLNLGEPGASMVEETENLRDHPLANLYSMYDHSVVWDRHQEQINTFIDLVGSKNTQLTVVIFPNTLDPFSSIPYVDQVAQAIKSWGYDKAQILKLFDAAEAIRLNERIVSDRDAQAGAKFNWLVGNQLYEVTRDMLG